MEIDVELDPPAETIGDHPTSAVACKRALKTFTHMAPRCCKCGFLVENNSSDSNLLGC